MVLGSYHGRLAEEAYAAPRATSATGRQPPGGAPAPGSTDAAQTLPRAGSEQVRVAEFTREAPLDQTGRTVSVRVEVENEMPTDPEQAAAQMADILQDRRSWSSKQQVRFAFVGAGSHDLVIRVLTPATTDKHCHPLRTLGEVSCFNGATVNLNGARWETGVPDYGSDLDGYRTYLINHEVGHYLGRGHVRCPDPGRPAPVMMQQTKGLEGCARNPWP